MARPIAKDYDSKRIHILKTAAHVFANEGPSRASMSQVALACGISKANIYHYYDGKNALLFDILDTYLSELRNRVCGLPLDGIAPDQKLRLIVHETLIAYDGMDDEHKIQTEGIALLPKGQQDRLRDYQRDMVALFSSVLQEIAPTTFGNDRAKLRAATMSVFGMLNWFYMWSNDADAAAREDYADLVSRMTLGGIKAL